MNISQSIHNLLYQYDCVIIPGFGGLVCSYKSAKIHPQHHRFYPPSKKISFNQMLIMNDGLLANHIASSQSISYELALENISGEVYRWNKALSKGKEIVIDGVGSFNSKNGILQFEEDGSVNFLLDSYGLSTFQSMPIERKEKMKVVYKSEGDVERRALPALTKMAKYSVAAALISIAALTTYKLNLVPTIQKSYATLNPFNNEDGTYDLVNYEDVVNGNEFIDNSVDLKFDNASAPYVSYKPNLYSNKEYLVETGKKKEEIITSVRAKSFHIVGGCFGVESNAIRMVKKLKRQGFEANIPTKLKNLHVVSYQSFSERLEAEKFLQKVKAETNSQAWLLEK